MQVLRAPAIPESPARVARPAPRGGCARRAPPPFRIGAVQHRWHPDADEHRAALAEGVALAAAEGARLVCLQELTLSPYFAITEPAPRDVEPEPLPGGPTHEFASALAAEHGIPVHASLYEAPPDGGLGF